jgi:hypothetical protein
MPMRVPRSLAPSLALVATFTAMAGAQPIAPHPDNPRYFLFDGKPAFLITSGEHCGRSSRSWGGSSRGSSSSGWPRIGR